MIKQISDPVKRKMIRVNEDDKRLECNMITKTMVNEFHENIKGRIHKRNFEGRKVMAVEKTSPLKDWEKQKITFMAAEIPKENLNHTSPLVITVPITRKKKETTTKSTGEWILNRTLIDTGSSVDIIFYHAFWGMGFKDEEMSSSTYFVHGFGKSTTKPKGEIVVRIPLGEIETHVTLCVVDMESPYNMLLGRPWTHAIKAVVSTLHQCIKFPTPNGIGEIRGDVDNAKLCHQIEVKHYEGRAKKKQFRRKLAKEAKKEEEFRVYMIRAKEGKGIPSEISEEGDGPAKMIKEPTPMGEPKASYTAAEPTKEVNVGTIEEPLILRIGTKMDMEEEERTVNLLREYKDVFAGSMDEIPGIDPSIACHKLEINKNVRPFKQRIRKIATTYHSQIERRTTENA